MRSIPLKIETIYERNGYQIKKVTGFSNIELDMLNRMPYQDMKETFLSTLDDRNNGLGKQWNREAGVCQMWVATDGMFVEIRT